MRFWPLAAVLATACSTTYFPRPTPGLRVTMSDGSPVFWKDGKLVQKGGFGSDLAAALSDVPEAKAHAETWRSRNITGLTLLLLGAGMVGGGGGAIEYGAGFNTRNTVSLSLMAAGLLTAIVGTVTSNSGQSHLWDAMNLYNDRLSEPK
jgi:hypothetical protein